MEKKYQSLHTLCILQQEPMTEDEIIPISTKSVGYPKPGGKTRKSKVSAEFSWCLCIMLQGAYRLTVPFRSSSS